MKINGLGPRGQRAPQKGLPRLGSEDCCQMGIRAPPASRAADLGGGFLYELSQFLNIVNSFFFFNYAGQTQYICGQDSICGITILQAL